MILMIGVGYGCVQKIDKVVVPTDTAIVEAPPLRQWDTVRKEFWTAMLFTQLSNMPRVRDRFQPKHLHLMVRCAIKEYERIMEIDYFEKTFGKVNGTLSPQDAQLAYNITYQCSEKQAKLQRDEILKLQSEGLLLKDTI